MTIILWHRRDLRVVDNRALHEAAKVDPCVIPVFVVDPYFFRKERETCNDRIQFMVESLYDLEKQYAHIGSQLVIISGNTIEQISKLQKKYDAQVYYNNDTNMPFGFDRDSTAKKLGFVGWDSDAIIRNKYDRVDWKEYAQRYFHSSQYKHPKNLVNHTQESSYDLNRLIVRYPKEKNDVPKGGRSWANNRVIIFKKIYHKYMNSISKPFQAELYTSRLSAYFSFGCVSLREVYHYLKGLPNIHFYLTRLYWNQHFTQKLEDFPNLPNQPVNPFFESKYDEMYSYDEQKIKAWKEGRTGYPLVDASMRALVKTGFLNFRMRAMVASFFVFIVKQPWKIGADFMHFHLIDADTAINYAQWQMQAGLVGVHPIRIYNPTKQISDNDTECLFIKKYVPELCDATIEQIKQDPFQQTLFSNPYIRPIVDFEKESKSARNLMFSLQSEAKKVLFRPDIFKRASLSRQN